MLFSLISYLNSRQLSVRIVQHKKHIKIVQMNTLKQYCPNVYIFMFHGFGLAATQIDIRNIRKSGDCFLLVLQKHINTERNMI